MTQHKQQWPDIQPVLRYEDGPRAIGWLKSVLGFSENLVVPGADGETAHAQLTFGNGMIMLGGGRKADDSNPWSSERSGIYVVVENIDSHYERARAAGAEIVRPLADTDHGSREYSLRDLEGHLWSFGTYRP